MSKSQDKLSHHAYLVLGDSHSQDIFLYDNLIKPQGDPDITQFLGDTFTIEEARVLKERASTKGFKNKRIFILRYNKYTPESQNALLKTLEEPIQNTQFIIFGRDESLFLPTILSRVYSVRPNLDNFSSLPTSGLRRDKNSQDSSAEFVKMSLRKRLDFVKEFVDTEGREGLTGFLDSLLTNLKSSKVPTETLKKVFKLRKYSDDPAALPRLILEHLAFVI
ncbi:hypothetical protein KW790_00475 [Candidatus Parcubacteria bacterium]|nr:hypothetical protein [Candidatus Parcubacteria bacterium]